MSWQDGWQATVPMWGFAHNPHNIPQRPWIIGTNFVLECPFDAIQLILMNPSPFPQTIETLSVAPSAFAAPVSIPLDAQRNRVAWTRVTVDGQSCPVLPPAVAHDIPSVTLSDIIPLEHMPRADGGVRPLLFTRMEPGLTDEAYDCPVVLEEQLARLNRDTKGRAPICYSGNKDFLDSDLLILDDNPMIARHFSSLIVGVRFHSRTHCITLMTVGDSLSSGFATHSGFTNFAILTAANLSNDGVTTSFLAHATPGQTTASSIVAAERMLTLTTPDVITCVIDSPNNYTGLGSEVEDHRKIHELLLLGLIEKAARARIKVILLTPIPFANYDDASTYGVQRNKAAHSAKILDTMNIKIMDSQAILSEGRMFGSARPEFLADDQSHLNEIGHYILGSELQRIVANALIEPSEP